MPVLNSSKLEGCETKFRSDGSARGHQGELCLFLGVSGTNRPNSFSPALRKVITDHDCTTPLCYPY